MSTKENISAYRALRTFFAVQIGFLMLFQIGNFFLTSHGLNWLLGNLNLFGAPWALILTLALCSIDFCFLGRASHTNLWWAWILVLFLNAYFNYVSISYWLLLNPLVPNADIDTYAIASAILISAVRVAIMMALRRTRHKLYDPLLVVTTKRMNMRQVEGNHYRIVK